jgi:hypothetical protein
MIDALNLDLNGIRVDLKGSRMATIAEGLKCAGII